MTGNEEFYALLAATKAQIERDPINVVTSLKENFQPWDELIGEDDQSLQARPSATRSNRKRVRDLLRYLRDVSGPEVLLLCVLATTRTKLGKVTRDGLLPELERCWTSIKRQDALSDAVAVLERDYPRSFPKSRIDNQEPGPERNANLAVTEGQTEIQG